MDPDELLRKQDELTAALLTALKRDLARLQALATEADGHWASEDLVYRFYHHSFKAYGIQDLTERIVAALRALLPGRALNKQFQRILDEGTGRTFQLDDNARWDEVVRPQVEAYFHARYFLEMAVRYGAQLEEAPRMLPSGWAAFLYLFDLR